MSSYDFSSQLAAQIEEYLATEPASAVMEGGDMLFDLREAGYSVKPEGGHCILQLWSEERNVVRRITSSEIKGRSLRLEAQRFGQSKPSRLEFCPCGERRAPGTVKSERARYQVRLRRTIAKLFPFHKIASLHTAGPELPHGSACVCGLLQRGQSSWAVFGAGESEMQATLDEALTSAILWFDRCRQKLAGRSALEGLLLFLPAGKTATVQLRMAHLRRDAGSWHLFALDEEQEEAEELDLSGFGNLETRLLHCFDPSQVLGKVSASVAKIHSFLPQAETIAVSTSEVEFRLHGLTFARTRLRIEQSSFRLTETVSYGLAPEEQELTEASEPGLRLLTSRLLASRHRRQHAHPFYRAQSERWLESVVREHVERLDGRLDSRHLYAQVPALAGTGRAMIDLLGVTREGRLVVIELKAEEDAHLPLQGLDYWGRVGWLQKNGCFQPEGYFPGHQLSDQTPLLLLVAPSLHVHPEIDTVLRYLSPEVDWQLLGLDEHWRDELRVIFRKDPSSVQDTPKTSG